MKRHDNIFEKIIDRQNIKCAWLLSLRGKRKRPAVVLFSINVCGNIERLRERLLSDMPFDGKYRQFWVHDPKPRVISATHFDERVMHHAIMNVLEPVFERQMIFHTYACRKGKGSHRAVNYALKNARRFPFFLKLDVRKYFDSIDHDVLKNRLSRIIKDARCLQLLFAIIDSYSVSETRAGKSAKGLPIGNLTSQFFANFYLSELDHYILEQLKPCAYVRYMDDMVLWAFSKSDLKIFQMKIELLCTERLELSLKEAVLGTSKNGVLFFGWLVGAGGASILQNKWRLKKRKLRCLEWLWVRGIISEKKALERMNAVLATTVLHKI